MRTKFINGEPIPFAQDEELEFDIRDAQAIEDAVQKARDDKILTLREEAEKLSNELISVFDLVSLSRSEAKGQAQQAEIEKLNQHQDIGNRLNIAIQSINNAGQAGDEQARTSEINGVIL